MDGRREDERKWKNWREAQTPRRERELVKLVKHCDVVPAIGALVEVREIR